MCCKAIDAYVSRSRPTYPLCDPKYQDQIIKFVICCKLCTSVSPVDVMHPSEVLQLQMEHRIRGLTPAIYRPDVCLPLHL